MDRYQQFRAAEDLGGVEMHPDNTPDLRKKETPDRGVGAPGAAEGSPRPTNH